MGRHSEPHRQLKEIIVIDDHENITQRYQVDASGHFLTPPGMAAFAIPPPTPIRAERMRSELHPPPVPMIHGVYPPIRTLQTPDESDPFYAPQFSSVTVYSSRADFESDFRPWTAQE